MGKENITGILKKSCCVCMAAVLLTGCQKETPEVLDTRILVETQKLERGNLTIRNEFMGIVSPEEQVYVIPMATGVVEETYVELGDYVEAGEKLLKIDDTAAQLQLKSAELQLQTAQASETQALGGSLEMQRIQALSSINQLQTSINSYKEKYNEAVENIDSAEGSADELKDGIKKQQKTLTGLQMKYALALDYAKMFADKLDALVLYYNSPRDPQNPEFELILTQLTAVKLTPNELTEGGLYMLRSQIEALEGSVSSTASASASAGAGVSQLEAARDQYQDAITQAEANLETAWQTYNISMGQSLEESKALLETQKKAANLGIESAKTQLGYYTVKAPISGTIELANAEKHGMAQAGSPVYTISNKENMTVTFRVSDDIRKTLKSGQSIQADRNGQIYQAVITEVGNSVEQQSGLFVVKASISTGTEDLSSGLSVKVSADTYQTSNAQLLPYDAVYYDNGEAYVYRMQDRKAVKTFVKIGLFDDKTVEIVSGLEDEDEIIISWSPQLTDGIEVYTNADGSVSPEEEEEP